MQRRVNMKSVPQAANITAMRSRGNKLLDHQFQTITGILNDRKHDEVSSNTSSGKPKAEKITQAKSNTVKPAMPTHVNLHTNPGASDVWTSSSDLLNTMRAELEQLSILVKERNLDHDDVGHVGGASNSNDTNNTIQDLHDSNLFNPTIKEAFSEILREAQPDYEAVDFTSLRKEREQERASNAEAVRKQQAWEDWIAAGDSPMQLDTRTILYSPLLSPVHSDDVPTDNTALDTSPQSAKETPIDISEEGVDFNLESLDAQVLKYVIAYHLENNDINLGSLIKGTKVLFSSDHSRVDDGGEFDLPRNMITVTNIAADATPEHIWHMFRGISVNDITFGERHPIRRTHIAYIELATAAEVGRAMGRVSIQSIYGLRVDVTRGFVKQEYAPTKANAGWF